MPRSGRRRSTTTAPALHGTDADTALYEVGYELNNRPDWVGIQLGALAGLAMPLQR